MDFRLKKFWLGIYSFVRWTRVFLISLSLFAPIATLAASKLPEKNIQKNILVFGDSLSAAYGIAQSSGWVALLQKRLVEEKFSHVVVNASVSGETTIGGKNRLEAQLKRVKPNVVILELGANDGLRGLPINEMEKNLTTMIQMSQKAGAKVLLIGMKLPPNYGMNYTASFTQSYQTLSKKFKIPVVDFMLENVATEPTLVQQDGLHPNEQGQPIILENIWLALKTLLKK